MSLEVRNPRVEYRSDPLGIDETRPRFSWELASGERNVMQTAWRIVVRLGAETVWDTGRVEGSESIHREYAGRALQSRGRYSWTVTAWAGGERAESEPARFEMGLLGPGEWRARWIEPRLPKIWREPRMGVVAQALFGGSSRTPPESRLNPCPILRREFLAKGKVARARAYATAHGVYDLSLNGRRADDRLLAPEFTPYDSLLLYQTYDVTSLVAGGANTIIVVLADGWYGGHLGLTGDNCQYGDTLGLLLQLEIDYEGGGKDIVVTDGSWECTTGPIIYSDLFIGEKRDARVSLGPWVGVDVAAHGYANLRAQRHEPVRRLRELAPKAILTSPKGELILDVGQNIAGRMRFTVTAPRGTVLTMEHTEVLDAEGNFLNNIMGRHKDQRDVYVCNGGGAERWEPEFTFHGFRYVRLGGWPTPPRIDDFMAVVVATANEETGTFECSNPLLDRLQSNIQWSQRGNMISIPTDCPQRERMGWTGDIQLYAPTASYNQDIDAFLAQWLDALAAEQLPDGQVPFIVPYVRAYRDAVAGFFGTDCSCGWSDACIIVPLVLHEKYGDKAVLERLYPTMARWMDYVERQAATTMPLRARLNPFTDRSRQRYLWNTKFHFADWLAPSRSRGSRLGMITAALATRKIMASGWFAYTTGLMARIARILGRPEDEKKYRALQGHIRDAFAAEYVRRDGSLRPRMQGVCVMALQFDLIPPELRPKTFAHLVAMIESNGDRLDTGFLSVPFLLDVLCAGGREDLAWRLLYQERCPSWLYEVKQGATTMWEAWDNVSPAGRISEKSYNHYAFGCVGDWMYRYIAGIRQADVAYRRIVIEPRPDDSLTRAKASYRSVYGEIASEWEKRDGTFRLKVRIPCNTTAEIRMPNGDRHEVGSGEYLFASTLH